MIPGIVEHLALLPFALLEDSGDELTLVIGDGTDGLTTPQQMPCLPVLAILLGDGDQMIQAIVGKSGMPSGMAMVGDASQVIEAIPGVVVVTIIDEIAIGIVGGTQALMFAKSAPALDKLPDGIGLVRTHDGGAIGGGHAGEVIGAVVVEGEVLQQATMGFHQTIGVVIEIAPVGGVSSAFG